MKHLQLFALSVIVLIAVQGFRFKETKRQIRATEDYLACYSDVRDQFRDEAMTPEFAAMHENPLPFHLTNATGETIRFEATDGNQASGYFIKSKKKTNNWIFVIQEWWGLNDQIKQEAEKLSAELGDVNVLALDMYDGKVAATADSAMKLMRAATTPRLEAIVKGALNYAGPKARIFTIGWCFGGMWSLQSSILAGKQAAGTVMYYGRPENNLEKLKTLQSEVIGFFGNQDRSPSPEVVNAFEKDMAAAGKKITIHRYEANHGFANPSNPSFNKEATEDAHKKTIEFLKARL
ncbi:dienelactone hydrolase family protein [Sediminibacterium sp. C3]|uniref:dienelactone hydrolase family protein n=1 Tax=Sediminibacterium sp. C3 TaxID=1267211 RepID=UPI0003FFCC14|nr:dienelactone hydrolase family protein [Sediminibacterium sp. C3]